MCWKNSMKMIDSDEGSSKLELKDPGMVQPEHHKPLLAPCVAARLKKL